MATYSFDVIPCSSLSAWTSPDDITEQQQDDFSLPQSNLISKFPYKEHINSKIVLWKGNITHLEVDVICNSLEATIRKDYKGIAAEILAAAGKGVEEELAAQNGNRAGEVKITSGGYLKHIQNIFHTVCPRYVDKFQAAAEHYLHNCYKNSMQLLLTHQFKTIAFPLLHTERKNYPLESGAHIAIRTVRRFIEMHGEELERIVFCVQNDEELNIYARVLPLYFPRSLKEERAAISLLPENTGNEYGETIYEERKIRISSHLCGVHDHDEEHEDDEHENKNDHHERLNSPRENSDLLKGFTDRSYRDPLETKRQRLDETLKFHDHSYSNLLRLAEAHDLSDIEKMNLIYQSGVDQHNRRIIVIVGNQLPKHATEAKMERIFFYIVKLMEYIAEKDYILIYIHSNVNEDNLPEIIWLRRLYSIWENKYAHTLRGLYIVQATIWLKLLLTVMRPFWTRNIYSNLTYVDTVQTLNNIFGREMLMSPHNKVEATVLV